jgi:hypothetical protein
MLKRRTQISWKMRRFFINLGYRIRGIGGLRSISPPRNLAIAITIGLSIFLMAGGVFFLLEEPIALLPRGTGWTFLYPGALHLQTLNESILAGLLYILGFTGLFFILKSTRSAYNPRQAYLMLILGLMVTLIVVFYSLSMLGAKVTL